ncbi:helix-turn-helix transcriptional regulator [Kytococcus schroeteri]|uniref:helix-turn-helix transcriptional regulator n=1 Tax=Kytococcus schroeteri TaxID=138300 RepID=UPI0011443030|nr:WYL domain-containing protein [Kytococcus schroeteri]
MAAAGRGHDPNLKTERLLNLLLALLHTRRPLTKAEIRRIMPEYQEGSAEAFDRTFERDKNDLRALGVPVTTAPVDPGFDDEEGYRVDPDEYALPELVFSAEELTMLGVAARVWGQASLTAAGERALRKISAADGAVPGDEAPGTDADGPTTPASPALGVQPVIRTPEAAFGGLRDAIAERRAVTFDYRRSGAPVSTRRVHPWALLLRRGRWYVTGFDLDRDAPRVFRLTRVVGPVRATGRPGVVEVPADHDPAAMIDRATQGRPDTLAATVTVAPGRGVALRRWADAVDRTDAGDVLHLPAADRSRIVGQLAELGPDLLAVEPDDLRAQVVDRLEQVLATAGAPTTTSREG